MKSLQSKVLNVLKTGKQFSPAAIAAQLRTTEATVSARVADLRSEGYSIYSNTTKTGKQVYRLGRPSRAMVAAAYSAFGSQVFQ